jgi:C-terminal processing protease CtpA/Prc
MSGTQSIAAVRSAQLHERNGEEHGRDSPRRSAQEYAAQDPGGVSAQMLGQMRGRMDGERFPFEVPYAHPREGSRSSGHVYALVNRHCYSNAAVVPAMIQDYGLQAMIGEETADLPTTHASSVQFKLPNAGIVVTNSKAYSVRPSGDGSIHGVLPDHMIEHPLTATEDVALQKSLILILSISVQ